MGAGDAEDLKVVCPFCGQAARLGVRFSQVRRGERVVSVEVEDWACAEGCLDEGGASIFRFEDQGQLRRNEETIRAAWLERFSQILPRGRWIAHRGPAPRRASSTTHR